MRPSLINWCGRRGGYCFEQNGLFERVLREIGFEVRSLLGRVVLANPPQMPPRTHRVLVTLGDEQWIADVGFGGLTLTAPVRLKADIEQETPHGLYRCNRPGRTGFCSFATTIAGSLCTNLRWGAVSGRFCDG
jgi:arylamine N-acetyltransferase